MRCSGSGERQAAVIAGEPARIGAFFGLERAQTDAPPADAALAERTRERLRALLAEVSGIAETRIRAGPRRWKTTASTP